MIVLIFKLQINVCPSPDIARPSLGKPNDIATREFPYMVTIGGTVAPFQHKRAC